MKQEKTWWRKVIDDLAMLCRQTWQPYSYNNNPAETRYERRHKNANKK